MVLIAASTLFLVGCVSTKQFVPFPDQTKTVEDPTKARIYVMRPSTLARAISMVVRDNEKIIGSTGAQGFLCWEREPGYVVISSKAENTSTINIPVQAGQVYYIYQRLGMGLLEARNKMKIVTEDKGRQILLDECKPPKLEISSP